MLHHLTLKDALRTALRQHPGIVRTEQTRLAAQNQIVSVASINQPHVNLEGIGKDGPNSAPGLGFQGLANSSIIDNYGSDLVLDQVIEDFGKNTHAVSAQRFTERSAGQDEITEKGWVALQVYSAYDDVLLANQLQKVAQEDVDARRLTVRQAQARFDAGLISRVDVDLALTDLQNSKVELIRAQDRVMQATAQLNKAMGVDDPTASYELDDIPDSQVPLIEPKTTLAQDVAIANQQRPEVHSLSDQLAASGETVQSIKAEYLPTIVSRVSAGALDVQPQDVNQQHTWAGGLLVEWPLLTGGQVKADMQTAQHKSGAVQSQLEDEEQRIQLQVTQARLTLHRLIQSRPAIEEALTEAQDAVKLASERYAAGLGNIIEVEEAQLALVRAQSNVADLKYETLTAQANLRYSTGDIDYDLGAKLRQPGEAAVIPGTPIKEPEANMPPVQIDGAPVVIVKSDKSSPPAAPGAAKAATTTPPTTAPPGETTKPSAPGANVPKGQEAER
ncbi:MAG: TolC family protein [Candidatus Xenobia bacterium]